MMAGLNFIAWLVVTVLIMAGVALVIAIIFKYSGIFHYSNLLLIFLFFLDFCLSTTLMWSVAVFAVVVVVVVVGQLKGESKRRCTLAGKCTKCANIFMCMFHVAVVLIFIPPQKCFFNFALNISSSRCS